MTGKVYLVGGGPGDPGLLTLRGAELLGRAEVVVYDRLANGVLLDRYLRPEAERIYAGKSSDHHTYPQEEINRLLVSRALEGRIVVRLHGGDPFVFGRGGEEAAALAAAGVPFEVVPGVTSAVAVPAYAGIPVTHRGQNSSFAVVTGHEDPTKPESSLCWEKLSTGVGTLVFLMGLTNLPAIVQQLTRNGLPDATPVAVIRWGTWSRQMTLVGTLADIVARVREADFRPPAVIVVGGVVGLRETLRWWDNRPLFGKRVLVTRSREQAGSLSALLREYGADPVEVPVLQILPPESYEPLDGAIARLRSYDWVVFTSANGVKALMERLETLGLDVRALADARLAAIGPATAQELRNYHLKVDLVPSEYVAEEVAAALLSTGVAGSRILLPRADLARDLLAVELERARALVDDVVAYRTVPAAGDLTRLREQLSAGEIDVVTFASSSTVRYLVAGLGEGAVSLLSRPLIACIGPITADTARESGLRVDVVAPEHTMPGLVKALAERVLSAEC
ncbi:MAG: uroporphyrinogen-III C-methyltransferase [Chloroflexi bacterium]|nr:uroporphyrinogen-III C-methyltransferase [Chloroflexota bacterium]